MMHKARKVSAQEGNDLSLTASEAPLRKPWTSNDLRILRAMDRQGASDSEIAKTITKTESAVKSKRSYLGLTRTMSERVVQGEGASEEGVANPESDNECIHEEDPGTQTDSDVATDTDEDIDTDTDADTDTDTDAVGKVQLA
jgi:hypothetical protein